MIQLDGLTKEYPMGQNVVRALRGVKLEIEPGDFVAIMGPSGSGKSTLTQILGLLDLPTAGSYLLNKYEVQGLSEDKLAELRRQEVGFIFQQFNLLPRLSALHNVALPTLYSQGRMNLTKAQILLDKVGLGDRAHHRPNELSGGQQQRVAIARALINSPRILLADEPTGNLDSSSEKEIMKLLVDLNAQGITLIIVTHEEEIGALAQRVIRIRDGLVQSDERRQQTQQIEKQGQAQAHVHDQAQAQFQVEANQSVNLLSDVIEHLHQGVRTLMANKVRTLLSMLGILIGVAAVVAMLALGKGAQKSIEAQISSLGSNLLIMRPGAVHVAGVSYDAGSVTKLTLEDADALNEISGVKYISPTVNGRGQVTYLNKNWSTRLLGASPSYGRMHSMDPVEGRFFTKEESQRRERLAVIGQTVAKELFGGENKSSFNAREVIGKTIKINKVSFLVIGLLPEKGATGWQDQDDVVIIPVETAMRRLLGKEYIDTIEVEVSDPEYTGFVQDSALTMMTLRKKVPAQQKDEAFNIRNLAEIREALSQSSRTMSMLLAAIAAISLLVGGIGIMNIMLVSVVERTREIGLRKAVGARRRDILLQFLVESVVVSVAGGVLGIALGWGITQSLSLVLGWTTSISAASVLLAFGFSAGIGILFGLYPARMASLLSPIDALRSD